MQDAVDPHAHGELLLRGLHMDVGGTEVNGRGQEVVDQFDDGCLLCHLAQRLGIVAGEQVFDGSFLAHHIEHPVDLVVGGKEVRDLLARIEVVEGLLQGVIADVPGHAADRPRLFPKQRRVVQEPVEFDRRLRHEAVDIELLGQLVGVAEIHSAQLVRERREEHFLGYRSGPDQQRAEFPASRSLDVEGLVEIRGLDRPAVDEQLAQAFHAAIILGDDAQGRHGPA